MIYLIGHGCSKQQSCFMFTTRARTIEKNDTRYDLIHAFYTHPTSGPDSFSRAYDLIESIPVVKTVLLSNGALRHTVIDRNHPFSMEINIFEDGANYSGKFTIGTVGSSEYTLDEGVLEPSLIIPFMELIKPTTQWNERNMIA